MPQIPYEQEESAFSDRTPTTLLPNDTSPDAFGGAIGRATQQLGDAVGDSADVLEAKVKQQQQEDVANKVASFDFTPTELSLRNQAPADGTGYHQAAVNAYRNQVGSYLGDIDDPQTRMAVRTHLLSELPTISARTAEYEFNAKAAANKQGADVALGTINNKVQADPYSYDTAVQQSAAVIAARPDLTAAQKSAMSQEQTYNLGKYNFDGQLARAKTVTDLNNIAGELAAQNPNDPNSKDWSALLRPTDYHELIDKIGTQRKTLRANLSATADSALDAIKAASAQGVTMASSDLQQTQQLVAATGDINKTQIMAREMRNQSIISTKQRLPVADLRAQRNAILGDPGGAYPGLPGEVSTMINGAADSTGAPIGYLGGMTTSEYGSVLSAAKPKVDTTFAPQAVGADVNFHNYSPTAVNAATFAGQQLGAPLMVMKAPGSNTMGAAPGGEMDISTAGKSDEDVAKIAGALVDSGFTGIAQYPDHIHVGLTTSVPQGFGEKDGQAWGGWTYLSPAVAGVLKSKGFAAGASSDIIQRNQAAVTPAIDYTKQTQVVDGDGNPITSAKGIAQFEDSTFLGLMKAPGTAAQMGVDLTGKTDAQILALRDNPQISLQAAGIYYQQNKKTLENTLGRPVDDSEVYMAHLMGPGGAVSFLNAYKNDPTQSAADLMPVAAKNNPGRFYDASGKPYSVADVYNNISGAFSLNPHRVAFEDSEQLKQLIDQTQKELTDDPISHAARVGSHNIVSLDTPDGFAARGNTANSVAQYYGLPVTEMKPFTEDEANALKRQIADGGADKAVSIMSAIQSMGTQPAQAAMKQLDEKDPAFGYAGRVYLDGNRGVAADIMRGRDQLVKNPEIKKDMGIDDAALSSQFTSATGTALSGLAPADAKAVREAALAYWVQNHSSTNTTTGIGSSASPSFADSVQSVMGGKSGAPAIDNVNGRMVLLPKGVSASDMENAFSRMTLADYARMSANGKVPLYADGKVVDPSDIQNEAMPVAVGGGKYKIMLQDGSTLLNGETYSNGLPLRNTDTGRPKEYIFTPTAKDMQVISARPYRFGGVYNTLLDAAAKQ